MKKLKITPRFSTREIIDETIQKDWINFQDKAFDMGKSVLRYMQSYINSNRKRQGGTGNLSRSINIEKSTPAGTIFWGIGNVNLLQAKAPYWYVINYGKKVGGQAFIPGGGKFVPGYFGDRNRPDSSMKGKGTEKFTHSPGSNMGMYPGIIRPMNYIEATSHKLNQHVIHLLARFKRGK